MNWVLDVEEEVKERCRYIDDDDDDADHVVVRAEEDLVEKMIQP